MSEIVDPAQRLDPGRGHIFATMQHAMRTYLALGDSISIDDYTGGYETGTPGRARERTRGHQWHELRASFQDKRGRR